MLNALEVFTTVVVGVMVGVEFSVPTDELPRAGRSYRGVRRRRPRSSLMWIIAGHVTVDGDERDMFIEAHRDLVERARRAPGCLDVAITADPIDPRRINNYERWESWDAVEEWRARADAPDTGIALHDVDVTAFEVASTRPPF